jgi:Family of unknown function (DUF5519)
MPSGSVSPGSRRAERTHPTGVITKPFTCPCSPIPAASDRRSYPDPVVRQNYPAAGDTTWDAVVDALLGLGPAAERPSRYADKPAVVVGRREVAHYEGDGVVDLRITAAGWREVPADLAADPTVHHERSRRDWIELRLSGPEDLQRLHPLFAIAIAFNQSAPR